MTMTYHIRDEMLELRQRALNKIEEEGMSLFNPADVERLRNNDGYVERQDWFTKIDLPVDVNLKRLNKESNLLRDAHYDQPGPNKVFTDLKENLYWFEILNQAT